MESSIYTSSEPFDINFPNDISNDVIVIDTSVNRIGVNIMEPHYSIDVRDFSDVSGIIYTDYLKTGAIISDLTPDTDVCYNLGSQEKKWNEIHANYLEVSGIKIKDASQFVLGSGTGGDAIVFPSDISVNGDISCVNLNVDGITIKDASKFSIGGGSGDTNGIEFMANTTITGDLTITGNINSSYITSLINSGSGDVNITVQNNTNLNNQDIYSKYRGTNVLTDFSNQLVGFNPDIRTFTVVTMGSSYKQDLSWGISVSSFHNQSDFPSANIIDGNIDSLWYASGIYASITFDLNTLQYVMGLKISARGGRFSKFTLQKSNNGSDFTDIQEFSVSNSQESWTIYTFTFNLDDLHISRYFRLNDIEAAGDDVGISEIYFNILDSATTTDVSYIINDEIKPDLSLNVDTPYTFDLTGVSASHPFNIYTQDNNNYANLYSGAVIDGSFLYLTIDSGITTLYYDCSNHPGMGGLINVINTSNNKNFNVKFISDTNSIVRSNLTEYNRFDIASNSFSIVSTSEHNNQRDLCGIVIPLSEYYNINSTLDLTVTNNSVYDISIDFVLLRNNAIIDNTSQTITVNAQTTNNNIISNSLSRLTFGVDDTVNVAFLTYIQNIDNLNRSVNVPITGEYFGEQMNNYSLKIFEYKMGDLININLTWEFAENNIYGTNIEDTTFIDGWVDNEETHSIAGGITLPLGLYYDDSNKTLYRNPPYINWVSEFTESWTNINDYIPRIDDSYYDQRKLLSDTDNNSFHRPYTQAASKIPISFSNNSLFEVSNNEITIKANSLNKLSVPISIKTTGEIILKDAWNNYDNGGPNTDFNTNFRVFFLVYTNREYDLDGEPNETHINSQIISTTVVSKQGWSTFTLYDNSFNYNVDLGMYPEISKGDKISFKILPIIRFMPSGYSGNVGDTDLFLSRFLYGSNVLSLHRIIGNHINNDDDYNKINAIQNFNITFDTSMNTYIKANTIDLDINVNSFNLSVEKFKAPPPTNNFNITVQNNTTLNNQDIYSKYRGTNVLTDFSNQLVGYNPNIGTFTVLTGELSYLQNVNWVTGASTVYADDGYGPYDASNVMNVNNTGWFAGHLRGPDDNESISFDLGETKIIFGLRVLAQDKNFNSFKLKISNDNNNFTTVLAKSDLTNNLNSPSNSEETHTFDLYNAVKARYVTMYDINSFSNYANINSIEFNIFDTTSTSTTNIQYLINNEIQPGLSLNIDTPYTFDLTGVSSSHPFNIYTDPSSLSLYTSTVIDGNFIYLTIDSDTNTLYYNCSSHSSMGEPINVINQSNYQNINVKFINDINSIVRTDLTEYNKLDIASNSFNRSSTSGYTNSIDLCGVIIPIYGQYYDINSSLNLTVTNNSSIYDISIDFVLLHNNAVINNSPQTITVNAQTTNTNINISNSLSRLTFGIDDTVNVAFLTYIQDLDNLNRSVNIPIGEISYQQNQFWVTGASSFRLYTQDNASAQSVYSHYPYKCMNGNNAAYNQWGSADNETTGQELYFDLQEIKHILGLRIMPYWDSDNVSKSLNNFTLKISNDNNSFTEIKQFTLENGIADEAFTFDLDNIISARYIHLTDMDTTYSNRVIIWDISFRIFDTTNDQHLINPELQPELDISININSFNLEVSAPHYEEFEVGNLLTANDIEVDNIDIQNTLTIASETPTTAGDNLVFDGDKLTWKNAILDVREYIPTNDPVTQYGSVLYGTDYQYLGNSVAINSDGTRIVMGGAKMGGGVLGQIQVFEYKNGDWIQLGNTLVGGTQDELGTSVGMNSEGTRIIAGAPCSNNNHQGYANVYDFSLTTNNWEKIGLNDYTISGDTHSENNQQRWGRFVAINGSGNRVAISSTYYSTNTGRVNIYNLSNGQYHLDTRLNGENTNSFFGYSIKFSDSGNRLVVGARNYNNNRGKFYLYEKSTNGNWAINGSYSGGEGTNYAGETVNISGDGKVIMYSQTYNQGGGGRVWIGRETSDGTFSWDDPIQIDSGGINNDYYSGIYLNNFGNRGSITVNENGSRIAIGTSEYGGGLVMVFDYSFQTQQYTYKWHLHRTNDKRFGTSLDITDQGEFLIAGAPYKSSILNGAGDVNVYKINELPSSGSLYYETSGSDAYILKIQP